MVGLQIVGWIVLIFMVMPCTVHALVRHCEGFIHVYREPR